MRNDVLANRIANEQAKDLMRAAARHRLAHSRATGGTDAPDDAGTGARIRGIGLVLSWARRRVAAWRALQPRSRPERSRSSATPSTRQGSNPTAR